MQLHEIKDIYLGDRLYENLIASDELLDEGAKELFAAGKQKMGQAAEKLKDAVDAPAQKAWAEVQSRLATAGKDDAIDKLKAFASKNKVAIGTMAIIGMGLLTATDASAGDAVQAAAGAAGNFGGGGGDILQDVLSNIQQMGQQQGMDLSNIGNNLQGIEVNGIPIQDYAEKASQAVQNAVGSSQADMKQAATDNIQQAIIDAVKSSGQQTADAGPGSSQQMPGGGSQYTGQDGRKVNFSKGVSDTIKSAMGKG